MRTKLKAGGKSLRETLAETSAAERLWAAAHGTRVRDDLPAVPAKRIRSSAATAAKAEAPAKATTEADALKAIAQYLATRGDVIMAVRQNSGMAQSANGAPVYFYRWVRQWSVGDIRIPDIWGMDAHGKLFAIEVKRPGWKRPTDQREIEQQNFLTMVQEYGGRAGFATSVEEAAAIMGPDMGDDH